MDIVVKQMLLMLSRPYYYNKIVRKVRSKIYTKVAPLQTQVVKSNEPIPFYELNNHAFEPIKRGEKWGKMFDCAWFKLHGIVPEEASGKPLVAIIDIKGEGCVMDNDGTPLKGLTTILCFSDALNSVSGKKVFDLSGSAVANEQINLLVEAGNNGIMGFYIGQSKVKRAELAVVNQGIYDLYFDMVTLAAMLTGLDKNSERKEEIDNALNKACKVLKKYTDSEVQQARAILAEELSKQSDDDFEFYATGHAHLDLAWLWPIRETKRKAGRTIANQLDLIYKFPDYIYCASQPQMYQWVKDIYPKLYDKVKEKVASGNIEPVGGMWVEPDCNVPSGESLIRQIMYGKRFFREEFGKDMKVLLLPDVFGFTGALPQLIKKSGMDYFLTTKMSWNEFNQFPHHSFNWQGIDGTSILAHCPPIGNYNSDLSGYSIKEAYSEYKEKDTKIASILFGAGDGGGGPSEVHLEMLNRQQNIKGSKKIKKSSVIDFFNMLNAKKDSLPIWQGELYLEKHTGTFTTQAKTKYYNRKIENLLHEVETLSTITYFRDGIEYPHNNLNEIWKELLLYQFHDIIPGSSIKRVYDECVPRYIEMYSDLKKMKAEILEKLSDNNTPATFNPTSFARDEWVENEGNWYKAKVQPYSVAEIKKEDCDKVSYDEFGIYSDMLSVKFWTDGSISSLIDKERGKEYAGTRLNRLAVYKDKRVHFNAWDIHHKYINNLRGYFKLIDTNTFVDGARVIRRNFMRYNKSTLTQDIILTAGCPYVEFVTTVDWHEKHKMLRANFEPSVFSDEVTCNIQFGNIKRTTRTDDLIGYAQYEIPAQKWVDVSADGYGLALLNDCKYGHRVKDGLISLNLLRSTVYPDKTADRGEQTFKYALYPHPNTAEESEIIKLGYTFNNPLEYIEKGFNLDSFVSVDNDSIIIEAIKKAEDSDAIVIRLYESKGKEAKCSLKLSLDGYKAYNTNLCEDIEGEVKVNKLNFGPFEIKTIMFVKK